MGDNGRLLVGDKGLHPQRPDLPRVVRQRGRDLPRTIPRSPEHYKEWILAAKGGKPAGSNFDWAGPLAESVLLGNVALRVQLREELTLYRLFWDSENLKFTNLDDANKFVRREYRAGWNL